MKAGQTGKHTFKPYARGQCILMLSLSPSCHVRLKWGRRHHLGRVGSVLSPKGSIPGPPRPTNGVHQQMDWHRLGGGRTSLGDTRHSVLCELPPIASFCKRWKGEAGSEKSLQLESYLRIRWLLRL